MVSLRGKSLIGVLAAFAALAAGFPKTARAWPDERKRKLAQIEGELKAARAQIRVYEKMEEALSSQTQSLENNRAKIEADMERLRRELARARANRKLLESRLTAMSMASGLWRSDLRAEIQDYSDQLWARGDRYGSQDLWKDLLIQKTVLEQAAVLERLRGMGQAAVRHREQKKSEESRILTQSEQVQAQAKQEDQQYQNALAQMELTRQKKEAALAHEQELEASAQALTRLIRKLKSRRRQPRAPRAPWRIAKNSLPWPAAGRVIETFGRRRDPSTGVWTISRGILIATPSGAEVSAVGDAQIIYAGKFRSYGEVLILDHGGNFFSIYGHLGRFLKSQGQSVKSGDPIALTGPGRNVYLEIREGTQALDPLDWLRKAE